MAEKDEAYRAPLLWLLLPYVGGLALADWIPGPVTGWMTYIGLSLATCAGLASWFASSRAPATWATCLAVAGLMGGVLRMQQATAFPSRWSGLPPREASLEVELIRVFPAHEKKPTASAIARIRAGPQLVGDLVGARIYVAQVELPFGTEPLPSQVLHVSGILASIQAPDPAVQMDSQTRGPDSFREFLLSNAVYFKLTRCQIVEGSVGAPSPWQKWRAALGQRFAEILAKGLPRGNAATGAHLAMFLGKKDALPDDVKQDYMQTGAMHLFAISGLHIAAIAACMHGLLRLVRLPDLLRALVGILALVAFVEATGGTPSARRALVMVALVWTGASLRRPANPIASIATAACAVLVVDPLALRSISFQFSYAVVAMLLLYGAPLTNRWLARWHPWAHVPDSDWRWWHRVIFFQGRKLIILTCTSWAAALISTPLTIAYFGLASPGAVVANLVLVPVSLYSITAGFASLLCGLCGATWLSVVFNHASVMLLTGMNFFAHVAADWPGMFFLGAFSAPWQAPVLVTSLLALCLLGYGRRWSRMPGGLFLPPALLVGALVLLVTPLGASQESGAMKSAYELAMERLQRSEPDAGRPLTPEQKERLAEIDRVFQGRIAEREIFLKQKLAEVQARGELEEAEKLRQQIAHERARLEEDREAEKEQIRRNRR